MSISATFNPAWKNRASFSDPALDSAWTELTARFESGEIGFFGSVEKEEVSNLEETRSIVQGLKGQFDDCLYLGIGGSSLGPQAVLDALSNEIDSEAPRIHFLDHPGSDRWMQTLRGLNPERTLVCSVTKSGSTFETLSQTLLALDWLGKGRWKTHFLAITDPKNGDLRSWVEEKGLRSLPIHPSLGGRFSVFSPVGFVPMELAGISTEAFVSGARQARSRVLAGESWVRECVELFLSTKDSHPQHVSMPYTYSLRTLGAWFVQLWGESLGKDGQGFTPLAAVGPTDQHSLLQLLRDGPNDKITLFVTTPRLSTDQTVPRSLAPEFGDRPSFTRLLGHSLDELVAIEHAAIEKVLSNQDRPAATFHLESLDAAHVGEFMMDWAVVTSWLGTALKLNPFDQPGVEEGKIYIKESLAGNRG
jgi:glucose-6-phosphate isomerase